MSLRGLWQRVRSLLRPGRVDDEIAREIAFHLEMEAKARGEAGLSPDEAQREARRRFGGVTQAREEVHDVRGMTFFEMLRQDLKFGLRTLRRSPGYTTAAILILSLGIGANTAMFSVLNGVLLKPLPFTDGDELVLVQHQAKASRFPNVGVSIPELNGYRQRASLVHDLVEYHSMSFTLLNQGEPDRVDTGVVDAGFFDMLGIRPIHGRAFLATDDDLGAEAVLLLSHRYWVEKFGADPKVIGRVLEMNNRPHTVVGVLPDFPEYPRHNDVYMPTSACPFRVGAEQNQVTIGHRAFASLTVIGRLKDGRSPEAAAAELAGIAASFEQDHSSDYQRAGVQGLSTGVRHMHDQLTADVQGLTWMLSGVTLLVLIIACANVANLSLARTTARERELAVRAALGAGRSRLLRQLLTESLLLALCGGAIGVGLAWISLDLLVQFVGRFTARTSQIEIDATVLAYSVAAAVLSGLVFGIVPALAARRNLVSSMRLGGSQAGETPQRQYTRSALVVAQVAVSSVLLVGAGLLLESAWRLAAEPLGYDGDRVLTAALTTSDTATSPPVAVINASMAKYWEGADPVGSIFQIPGGNGQPLDVTVVGVVPDFRLYSADQELQIPAQFYLPSSQTGGFAGRVMIRTAGDPMTFVPALKEAVHGVNAGVPVEEVQTLADLRDERQASPRLTTALLSIFAMTALTITLVGLAGVIATSVSHRTREFGLRLALGASPRSVVAIVVRQGAWMVGLGLLAGIAGAIGLSQVLSAYLYETQPTDPSAYLGVIAVFLVAGALACLGPARRATGIDPLASLRSE